MGTSSQPWTIQDYDYIYKHYNTDGPKACAEALGKLPNLVNIKAQNLDIRYRTEFTTDELKMCRQYSSIMGTALIFLMPNRTVEDIKEMIKCSKESSY